MLEALLLGLVEYPLDEERYLVLSDWLEEYDDPRRAELLRLHRRLLATCREPDEHPDRAGWQARIVELLVAGVRPCVPQKTVTLGKGRFPLTFSFDSPGPFLMGSPEDEAGRQEVEVRHRVTLTEGFWLGSHPVTQAQWKAVTGRPPRGHRRNALPVQRVSWDDCGDFCRGLGEETGRRFRLPTEAEWEFACRCGTTTPFYYGEALPVDHANYNAGPGGEGVSRGGPTPAGDFPPNAFGLYDVAGNVWEWCSDRFGPYGIGESVDPRGADSGSDRVIRGGSWFEGWANCRSGYRGRSFPRNHWAWYSCRVVLCPDDQGP